MLATWHLDQLQRAPKSDDADVSEPVPPPDERILEKPRTHAPTVAPYFMYYNFGRVHQTLRVTPAMEAGIADHAWAIEETVALLG